MLCTLVLLARLIYPSFIRPKNIIVVNLPLIPAPEAESEKAGSPTKRFAFDPNTVKKEQLIALGFRDKTAGTLIRFREKGFVFRKPEDLKKVYGVTESLYSNLAPFIVIPKTRSRGSYRAGAIRSKIRIELNAADSLQLLEIRGVGPSFAKRILKYRSILGGYARVEQLKEVYGFTEEMFREIEPQVTVNPALIRKIDLNRDDFKTVNRHPYISYELTKLIFEKKRREIITPEVLRSLMNDEELFKKLEPYLIFDL